MSNVFFGTDGIRARFGTEPMTPTSLAQLGHALAQWARDTYNPQPSLLLAHDTRLSCSVVKSALKSGLLQYPINVCDAQVLPAPALAVILQTSRQFNCGIIISASHNPYYDNGIKIVDAYQGKLSSDAEKSIANYFNKKIIGTDYASLGKEQYIFLEDEYIRYLRSFFQTDFLRNKKVVLDCAHGATYILAPKLFKYFGANAITLFDKPNGLNINKHCGSMYPETLQKAVLEHNADIGFAFDGDGDRVLAVNRFGQLKTGDDILALLLSHPRYKATDQVVGTIMTNKGFELFLQQSGRSLIRTAVGDKHVTNALKEGNLVLGGEPSGHIILRDYLMTGDGIFTALRVAQALAINDNWDMHTFVKFPQIHSTIPVRQKKDLNEPPFSEIIAASKSDLHQGRLIIRYSGTEPILRIMVEDEDFEHAQSICSTLSKKLQIILTA